MIHLTLLYDEYIDRPKLTEHKNPFEYIVHSPQVGSEQRDQQWDANTTSTYLPMRGAPI